MVKLSSKIFKVAGITSDIEKIFSGDPTKILKQVTKKTKKSIKKTVKDIEKNRVKRGK